MIFSSSRNSPTPNLYLYQKDMILFIFQRFIHTCRCVTKSPVCPQESKKSINLLPEFPTLLHLELQYFHNRVRYDFIGCHRKGVSYCTPLHDIALPSQNSIVSLFLLHLSKVIKTYFLLKVVLIDIFPFLVPFQLKFT